MDNWKTSALPFMVVVKSTSATEQETIYPDIKYIFSDDEFNPTIDILQNGAGAVIVDFDERGEAVTGHGSLSTEWQITDIRLVRNSSESEAVPPAPTSATTTVDSSKQKDLSTRAPPWAEAKMETDSVANVLYLDGVSTKGNAAGTMARSTVDMKDVEELINGFQKTNEQIRQILSHTKITDELLAV